MGGAVDVDPVPAAEPVVEAGPFLRQEPGLAQVALPVLEVVLVVGDVEVAGDDGQRPGRVHDSSRAPMASRNRSFCSWRGVPASPVCT